MSAGDGSASAPERAADAPETDRPAVSFDLKERAMDEAPVGITIADANQPDVPLVYVNDAFVRLTGYDREEVLGRNCRFLQGPETAEEPVATLAAAIEDEESVTVVLRNYRRNGEAFWNEVTIAPLRNEAGDVTHFVGFQADVTQRVAAERAVEAERRSLATLLDRIEGLIEGVTRELLDAPDRHTLAQAVCREVVESTPFGPAWIGDLDREGGRVEAIAVATAGDTEPEDSGLVLSDNSEVAEAIADDEVRIVPEVILENGAAASGEVAVVPLTEGTTLYGVLLVHAQSEVTFDDRETAILGSLGRVIATGLDAIESRRLVASDDVVEVALEVSDEAFVLARLTAETDARVSYTGSISRDGSPTAFFTVDGDAASILERARALRAVESARVISEDSSGALLELRFEPDSLLADLLERGARPTAMTGGDDAARLEFEIPARADSRAVVDDVRERYRGVELVRYRERTRPPQTKREFVADVREQLSRKQLDALERAYHAGYYAAERRTDGEELASSMDISRPTFHHHRRTAERRILRAFFGDESS